MILPHQQQTRTHASSLLYATSQDYEKVRALIKQYLKPGQAPPVVISGEWGYCTCKNTVRPLQSFCLSSSARPSVRVTVFPPPPTQSGDPIWCNGGASTGINTEETQAKFLARQW